MKSKISTAKTLDTYGALFKKAWKTTWMHKELWIIGLIASAAYSGSILQQVLSNLIRVSPAESITSHQLLNSLDILPYIVAYTETLLTLGPARITITIIAGVIFVAAIAIFAIAAQQTLLIGVHRAAKRKKHLSFKKLISELKHLHVMRIFSVNAFIYIGSVILVAAGTLTLSLLLGNTTSLNFLSYMAVYAITLPFLFAINILGMFMLIHVIRKDEGIITAFHRSMESLKKHWLSAFEMTILLFFVNLLATGTFFICTILLIGLATPVFFTAISLSSTLIMSLVVFIVFLFGLILYTFLLGAVTTFNYSVWTEFVERVERFSIMPVLEKFLRRQ
jgi:hypothetical protein